MFLCEECSPVGFQSFLQSRGKCEDCGKLRACNDVPTDLLTGTADDAIPRSTVAAMEAHLKQTAAPARPEGLKDALHKIAFWLPVVGYEANETRYVNIEEVFAIKRLAADALERALAEKAGKNGN